MTATILNFTPPLRIVEKPEPGAEAFQCSLPCDTALDFGPGVCSGCEYSGTPTPGPA